MIYLRKHDEYADSNCVFYYDENGEFSGSFDVASSVEIWDLEVFEQYRGKRYCEKMITEYFDTYNPDFMVLWVEENNSSARKAYERMGFIYVENLEYPELDLLKMRKENYG